jgi:frataxin-like iron-binding protein CyaY
MKTTWIWSSYRSLAEGLGRLTISRVRDAICERELWGSSKLGAKLYEVVIQEQVCQHHRTNQHLNQFFISILSQSSHSFIKMARNALTRVAQRASRQISPQAARGTSLAVRSSIGRPFFTTAIPRASILATSHYSRSFTTSRPLAKGLSPETDNPQPKEAETNDTASSAQPANITAAQYEELSDQYLDSLIQKLEQLQEESEEVDCEYSVGAAFLHCFKLPYHLMGMSADVAVTHRPAY